MTFYTVVPIENGGYGALRTTFPVACTYDVMAAVITAGTMIARGVTPQEALRALREEAGDA